MNLVAKLVSHDTFIEGIHKNDLERILNQSHPSIRISVMRHGNIILNNNKIIKCAHTYYNDSNGKVIPRVKGIHACHEFKKAISADHIPPNSCLACHLYCLQQLKEGNLTVKC